jgi:protocatechuate 3,4-dioxygenase beta subunit
MIIKCHLIIIQKNIQLFKFENTYKNSDMKNTNTTKSLRHVVQQLNRRDFTRLGLAALGASVLVRCVSSRNSQDEILDAVNIDAGPDFDAGGHIDAGNEDAGDTDAGMSDAGDGGLEPTCGELTESNIEGPFFTPDSPQRTELYSKGMKGVYFELSGVVLDTQCKPIPYAFLDFWQADDDGAYDNQGMNMRGHQYTDQFGAFHLKTIIPGHYLNGNQYRPAHIHVKVARTEMTNGQRQVIGRILTTQLYFSGDPYNSIDPFIRESLIMKIHPREFVNDGSQRAFFTFVIESL